MEKQGRAAGNGGEGLVQSNQATVVGARAMGIGSQPFGQWSMKRMEKSSN